MGLVSKKIPNLINGISQQPPALRLPTQGNLQENGLSDVVDGLKKRPPTKFLKKLVKCATNWQAGADGGFFALGNLTSSNVIELTDAELATAVVQTYKRSDDEQYTVVILPHASAPTILVYDILGNLRYESGKSSWLGDGTTIVPVVDGVNEYTNNDDTSYLVGEGNTVLDNDDITTTSIADATFIVNKKKIVRMSDTINPKSFGSSALVYLNSVNYGRNYRIDITSKENDGSSGTVTSGNVETLDANELSNGSYSTTASAFNSYLKVSNVIGDLRSGLLSDSATSFSGGGQQSFNAKLSGVTTESHFNSYQRIETNNQTHGGSYYIFTDVLYLVCSSSTYNVNPDKMVVTVGGTGIAYDPLGVNGWRYQGAASGRTIRLPSSVLIKRVQYYQAQLEVYVVKYERPTTYVQTVANVLSSDVVVQPIVYTKKEPYFVVYAPQGGVIKDFDIAASDDDGGGKLKVFKDKATAFTDLPNQCQDGYRLGVVGDNNRSEDDFYVVFRGGSGSGYWQEGVAYDLQNFYDTRTMPHTLRQKADLSFSFGEGSWNERKAGDDETNPQPSFVNNTINDIFFHRNRLGLLSGENVIFSGSNDFFNFFRTTVRTLLDSDPIDVAVSQNEVSTLKSAIPVQDSLLIFSELNQFTLTSSQLLTPTDVTIDRATKFECDLTATPVGAGNSVFFSTRGGNYAGVREFYTDGERDVRDADLVTSHVPEYLEGTIKKMAASTNENLLVCLTSANKKEVYIYKWYDADGDKRVQSAWSKWIFDTDVVDISFNNSNLYITFGDGRFETMAVRTDAPDVSFGNSVSFPAEHGVSSYSAGIPFTDTTVSPNVLKAAVSFTALAHVNGNLAGLAVTSGGTSPFASISINTPLATGNIQSLEVNGRTFNITDSEYVAGTTSQYGVEWKLYQWDLPLNSTNVAYLVGLVGQEPIFNVGMIAGVNFAGKKHDVLLDHKVRLTHTTNTPITSISELDAAYPDMDANTKFINFRGEIVATGNTTTAKNLVISHLYNAGTSAAFTHVENDATVSNYVDVGQPYTFKYGVSEQVFEPKQGDTTSLARFQLRNMTFNFNSTGTFDVTNETVGRLPATSNFTGRLLGQTANIIGYAAVVDTGNHTINIQSQASNAKITITNDTHLPSTFQSAEWEGYVVLRNQRL